MKESPDRVFSALGFVASWRESTLTPRNVGRDLSPYFRTRQHRAGSRCTRHPRRILALQSSGGQRLQQQGLRQLYFGFDGEILVVCGESEAAIEVLVGREDDIPRIAGLHHHWFTTSWCHYSAKWRFAPCYSLFTWTRIGRIRPNLGWESEYLPLACCVKGLEYISPFSRLLRKDVILTKYCRNSPPRLYREIPIQRSTST